MTTTLSLSRGGLITKIAKVLADHQRATYKYETACRAFDAAHQDAWWQANQEKLREIRDTLTKVLRSGGTVLPKKSFDVYTKPSSWEYARDKDLETLRPRSLPVEEYRALLAVLKDLNVAEVTLSQLQRLGFRNVGDLYRDAL